MFICERKRWPLILLLMGPHLYGILSHLPTHTEARFLLPSIFCWLTAFAYVITRPWRKTT